ncbi:Dynein light chain roadblock-type [Fasciolopsis buskii]|uniref:Dynein light chain roadblock-type n=1 Tax=Fasciolopsis buskii TaxID=27845 RepID=A0A8E0RRE8_9TREM|nr:Dynein light chain roadblock-type [Fasciolopsis buski]
MENTITVSYCGLIQLLATKARTALRDLDPTNDLTFLRIRSKKNEIMVAPDRDYSLIVIQEPAPEVT